MKHCPTRTWFSTKQKTLSLTACIRALIHDVNVYIWWKTMFFLVDNASCLSISKISCMRKTTTHLHYKPGLPPRHPIPPKPWLSTRKSPSTRNPLLSESSFPPKGFSAKNVTFPSETFSSCFGIWLLTTQETNPPPENPLPPQP